MIEPLAARLSSYFYFFGVRGAFLMQLGRDDEARERLRPRHRAGQHLGRGRPYPHASRPPDARQPALRPGNLQKISAACRIAPAGSSLRSRITDARWDTFRTDLTYTEHVT